MFQTTNQVSVKKKNYSQVFGRQHQRRLVRLVVISSFNFLKNAKAWRFPQMGVAKKRWFILEIPIKMDDLGVPSF
jgi:hypothetical protein